MTSPRPADPAYNAVVKKKKKSYVASEYIKYFINVINQIQQCVLHHPPNAFHICFQLITRPSVAGAVLQTISLPIKRFTISLCVDYLKNCHVVIVI